MVRNAVNSILQNKNALMFITAVIFMCGILGYFNDNALFCALIFTVSAIFVIARNYIPVKIIIFWILAFYAGFFNAYLRIHTTDSLVAEAGTKVTIKGQVVSIPNSGTSYKTKFFFKVYELNGDKIKGKTLATVSGENFSDYFQVGDFYEMNGNLRTPFKAGNPSQFDYGKYLKNFDTFTVFYTEKQNCRKISDKLSFKWECLQKLNVLRDKIIKEHSKYLKSPNLEILGGIVFGDDAIAPPDYIKSSFGNSGLLHILAASGMNVAFIYGFWVFFMRRIRAPYKFSVITGMGIVILYTLMTGLGASVIRASLMLLFILVGKLIDRDAHSVSLLALVAMIMLIYNPAFINDVGFQLSFIVTFGILTTANVIFEKFGNKKYIGVLLIPIVAQIWVAPVQMFYFNTFSTYSIFANILSLPFLSAISFGGFIGSIIAMFAPMTDKICMVIDFVLNYILSVIVFISNFFAHLKLSLITTTHPNILQILLYYSLILFITMSLNTGFNRRKFFTITAIIFVLILSSVNISSKSLQVTVFDVQNADCFLIKSPENKYFIIDTGRASFRGSKAQANSIIIKYLKDRGIRNIEAMIITHFDNDHSGGASDIINNFYIKNVYINSYADKTMTSIDIYKNLKKYNIKTEIPENGSILYIENNFSLKAFRSDLKEDNEKSIITLLSYKDFDMLFTGDAGVEAFEYLKSYLPHNVEVLKVGHHGGTNVVNAEMLKHLNSKVSVISTGSNAFGHPSKGTLDILRNTEIYRTDRHNSIRIETDGEDEYKVFMYRPDKHKYFLSKSFKLL